MARFGIPQLTPLNPRSGLRSKRREWSEDLGALEDRVPDNSVVPAITGDGELGALLTASTGTWTRARANAYTYQWERNGTPISGATASTYEVVEADVGTNLTVVVTAYNTAGTVSAESATKAIT